MLGWQSARQLQHALLTAAAAVLNDALQLVLVNLLLPLAFLLVACSNTVNSISRHTTATSTQQRHHNITSVINSIVTTTDFFVFNQTNGSTCH